MLLLCWARAEQHTTEPALRTFLEPNIVSHPTLVLAEGHRSTFSPPARESWLWTLRGRACRAGWRAKAQICFSGLPCGQTGLCPGQAFHPKAAFEPIVSPVNALKGSVLQGRAPCCSGDASSTSLKSQGPGQHTNPLESLEIKNSGFTNFT